MFVLYKKFYPLQIYQSSKGKETTDNKFDMDLLFWKNTFEDERFQKHNQKNMQ